MGLCWRRVRRFECVPYLKEARCSGEGEVPGDMIRLFFLFWTIEEDRKCRLESNFEAVLESLAGPEFGFKRAFQAR